MTVGTRKKVTRETVGARGLTASPRRRWNARPASRWQRGTGERAGSALQAVCVCAEVAMASDGVRRRHADPRTNASRRIGRVSRLVQNNRLDLRKDKEKDNQRLPLSELVTRSCFRGVWDHEY